LQVFSRAGMWAAGERVEGSVAIRALRFQCEGG
jgi:hypothetical protein